LKEKDPKPNRPDIEKILRTYPEAKDFHRDNILCGKTIEAAYESMMRFARFPQLGRTSPHVDQALNAVRMILQPSLSGSRMMTLDEVIEDSDLSKTPGGLWGGVVATKQSFLEHVFTLHGSPIIGKDYIKLVFEKYLPEGTWSTFLDEKLKLELRAVEKVKDDKLRTILGVCIVHVFITKMFMLNINQKFMEHTYVSTNIALGFSPWYGGMDRLARYLRQHSVGWEFDVGKMDANEHHWIIMAICKLLFSFLKPEFQTDKNKQIWHNLSLMLSMSPIIMEDGEIYLKGDSGNGGGPSGHFLTSILNSIFALFMLMLAFVERGTNDGLFNKSTTSMTIVSMWRKYVSAVVMGDDITYTTSLSWFRGPEVGFYLWEKFGVTLETPSEQPRSFDQLRFLSLGFQWSERDGMYIFNLNPNRVYSSILTMGKGVPSASKTLTRLVSIRLCSWGDEKTRRMVRYVIEKFVELHDSEEATLEGKSEWDIAKQNILTDDEMRYMYTGNNSEHVGLLARAASSLLGEGLLNFDSCNQAIEFQ